MGRLQRLFVGLVITTWFLVAVFIALVSLLALVTSIANSHYDGHTNRAPGALIGIAALATLAATCGLASAIAKQRGKQTPTGVMGPVALTILAAMLSVLWAFVSIASGPL